MNYDNFTDKSKAVILAAQNYALSNDHQQFTSLHVLKALLEDEDALSQRLIESCGGEIITINYNLENELKKLPKVQGGAAQLYITQDTAKVFEQANSIAKKAGDKFVALETLVLAIASLPETHAGKILNQAKINKTNLQNQIEKLRHGHKVDSASAEGNYQALKKYAKDVTDFAKQGKLDPVIGRDEEIRRTIQVLSRRLKNNPILIGEPGVGKTAIVEGIAQRIIEGDVPENLKDCKLISLDLGALIAGAKFRGEFEERLKSVLNEINAAGGEIILFIDEIHTLVGAGASEGSMDASNLLKPALARGDLHCIGATTLNEYRKYIEKDPALARRFQEVYVAEPSVEDTIAILRGIKEKYEVHHGIRITDSAIVAAATLSDRYITGRFLPDKAIDLIDESASRLRMEVDSRPEEVDELERKIIKLKIEESALIKENDLSSKERLSIIQEELKTLELKSQDLTSKWNAEKLKITNLRKLKEQLEQAKLELDMARRQGDLSKAGELTYGIIPDLITKISSFEAEEVSNKMFRESVTDQDIALIVSRITGIPLDNMMSSEKEKLLKMEELLSKVVIGQEEAISAVSDAIRRARAGIQDINRPIGSFMFLGPTGVGKTELTKALAQFMFEDKSAILRIDMSEYMEKHSIARLIGAPPGYVGYEEGGTLTEAVRRRPYQVILFDEVEKAHPDVFNLLLQVLDEGRLTDSKGNVVDFKNTIIILTSNLGSEHLLEVKSKDDEIIAKNKVIEVVRSAFRPEFLNRLDEIIIFHKLDKKHISKIVEIQIRELERILKEKTISLSIDEKACAWIAEAGFDNLYGARPLKRVIQSDIKNILAKKIIDGSIKDKDKVLITVKDKNLEILVY